MTLTRYVLTQAGRLHIYKVIVYLVYCFMTSAYDSSSMYVSVFMSIAYIYMVLRRRETLGKVMVHGHSSYIYITAPNNLKVSVLR